jgi:hypothetical protein
LRNYDHFSRNLSCHVSVVLGGDMPAVGTNAFIEACERILDRDLRMTNHAVFPLDGLAESAQPPSKSIYASSPQVGHSTTGPDSALSLIQI